MKKLFVMLAVAVVSTAAYAQHLGTEYRLKKVVEVPGRQGIAADKDYFYVSDTRGLYKFDKNWNLVQKRVQTKDPKTGKFIDPLFNNPDPAKGGANHFGDISVDIYDANTLQYLESIPWRPESGQVEVSGVAVDRERNLVWLSDWVDSRYVYAYSLETKQYYTKVQCRPEPYWCQGIFIVDGVMLLAADDGESTYHIADNVYKMDITGAPFTGLVQGTEPVKDTPWSVKTDKDGKVVKRTGTSPRDDRLPPCR